MKYRLFTIIFICLGSVTGSGQTKLSIPVTVFKESKAIDSLMDIVMIKRSKTFVDRKKPSGESCFLLYYYNEVVPGTFSFVVQEETTKGANEYLNKILKNRNQIGYFTYQNEIIFVCTGEKLYDFFIKTTEFKSFDFLYKVHHTYSFNAANLLGDWVCSRQGGQFINYTGPVVLAPVKN